jgi:hypothetical protein
MSDPSSFLSITVLIGITRICISSVFADFKCFVSFHTRKERDSDMFRVRKLDKEIPSDILETGRVNELFVVVTIFLCLREI